MKKCWVAFVTIMLVITGCPISPNGGNGDGDDSTTGNLDGYIYVTTGAARSIQVRGLREDIETETSVPLENVNVVIDGHYGISDVNGYFKIRAYAPLGPIP